MGVKAVHSGDKKEIEGVSLTAKRVPRSVREHPKGFGGDRKAPELGRELMLAFRSTVWSVPESPHFGTSGDGKTLVRFASSLFPACAGGHYFRRCVWFVHAKKSGRAAFVPYCLRVQRRGRRFAPKWDSVPRPASLWKRLDRNF